MMSGKYSEEAFIGIQYNTILLKKDLCDDENRREIDL